MRAPRSSGRSEASGFPRQPRGRRAMNVQTCSKGMGHVLIMGREVSGCCRPSRGALDPSLLGCTVKGVGGDEMGWRRNSKGNGGGENNDQPDRG